jgi:hypothetical protein
MNLMIFKVKNIKKTIINIKKTIIPKILFFFKTKLANQKFEKTSTNKIINDNKERTINILNLFTNFKKKNGNYRIINKLVSKNVWR